MTIKNVTSSNLPSEYFSGNLQVSFTGSERFLAQVPTLLPQIQLDNKRCLWHRRYDQVVMVILPQLSEQDLSALVPQLEQLISDHPGSGYSLQRRIARGEPLRFSRENIGDRDYLHSSATLGSGYGQRYTKVEMYFSVEDSAYDFFRATRFISEQGGDWQVVGEADKKFPSLDEVVFFAYSVSARHLSEAASSGWKMLLDFARQAHERIFGGAFTDGLLESDDEVFTGDPREFMASYQHVNPDKPVAPKIKWEDVAAQESITALLA